MSLTEEMLLEDIRQRLFSPAQSVSPRAVGAELELIPIDAQTKRVVPAQGGARSSSGALSALAEREGWHEEKNERDPSSWNLPDGARISFEPGGQIEISSSPHHTTSSLISALQQLAGTIRKEMAADGIELLARGVDPYNDIAAVPLQLHRERYTRMTDFFNSLGPSGVRMMRQTAALQINVERGGDPTSRWLLLNALAPLVIALFANSRAYAGSDTRHVSYRAHLWRTLDGSRTGLAWDGTDPAHHYLRFALNALAMRSSKGEPTRYQSFMSWMRSADLSLDDWHFHLSTLFPEVRPKAYFEVRSADTIDIQWLAAPIVFVTGLIYDPDTARSAMSLLGAPSPDLLERAGRRGLSDPELRRLVGAVAELSLSGARALGSGYLDNAHVESAREYFARALDA